MNAVNTAAAAATQVTNWLACTAAAFATSPSSLWPPQQRLPPPLPPPALYQQRLPLVAEQHRHDCHLPVIVNFGGWGGSGGGTGIESNSYIIEGSIVASGGHTTGLSHEAGQSAAGSPGIEIDQTVPELCQSAVVPKRSCSHRRTIPAPDTLHPSPHRTLQLTETASPPGPRRDRAT